MTAERGEEKMTDIDTMTATQTYALFTMDTPYNRKAVREFPTYADAVAHAKRVYEIVVFSEDSYVDYPAADFFTARGEVFAIEPINAAQ